MFKRSRSYRPSLLARLFVDNWKLVLDQSLHDRVYLAPAGEIYSLDLSALSLSKGLLWHSVEIRTSTRVLSLSGLSGNAARQLRDDLLGFVNLHLADLIEGNKNQLKTLDEAVAAIVDAKSQYIAQSDLARTIAAVPGNASQALSHPLFDAALMPDRVRAIFPASFEMITNPDVRNRYNEAFVAQELSTFHGFFNNLGGLSLSDEQREACIPLEDSNLLIASAGSGKSATMVGKVAYALEKGLCSPGESLVLAVNKGAADELKERIAKQLGVEQDRLECRVTTFHGLGYEIIEQVNGRPPQLANWVENAGGEARFINSIVDDLTKTNPEFHDLWIDLLTLYPKADLPPSAFESIEEFERYVADANGRHDRQGSTIGTLSGTFVKSLQEKRIANWLWRHSVEFNYELQMQTNDEDGTVRHVHPDFHYPITGTVHEHFAISADGTSPFPEYVTHADLKRAAFARMGVDFFETTSAESSEGSLLTRVEQELQKRGIPLTEKTHDEVMKAIAPVVVTHYHKIIAICIKHIRASQLSLDILLEKAKTLHDRNRADRFARAIWLITQAYSRKLEETQRIDFDSMIGDAVKMVETASWNSPYSLILVDEFQDISDPRAKLIKALRHQKAFTKFFAVGDDWQSIYRFTGSDITIFTQFEENFGSAWQGRLQQTYRCNQMLADAAARFVQRNPAQLAKNVVSARAAIPGSIRAIPIKVERHKPVFRDACFRVLERLDAFLGNNSVQWRKGERHSLKVLVLWRYNLLDPFQGRPPMFDNIEVHGLSFHRSKGLEADYTILLDVSEGDYGVPSRIEEDELLNLVIPRPETFQYAEERRLFYVALTRASRGTYLLYNQQKPSRYIKELCEIAGADVRFESVTGKSLRQCPICVAGQLVERAGPNDSTFLGCTGYPSCRHTEQTDDGPGQQRGPQKNLR